MPRVVSQPAGGRKRAVNLTISENLVAQAKAYTSNLSATMEELLADYVAQQQAALLGRQQMARAGAGGGLVGFA